MTFSTPPEPVTSASITMTASTAFDPSGVEYFFTCTSLNAPDSGWQFQRSYTLTGLTPGTAYTFTVMARDLSPSANATGASAPASATTFAIDSIPPEPTPMTFASNPTAISNTAISMTATTATDNTYDVEYYFTNTTIVDTSHDSGWQSSPIYTDSGLTPSTNYTYTVTARDTAPAPNSGAASAPQSTSTLDTDITPPSPSPPTWAVAPTALSDTSITMTATTASDLNGVEYYFANSAVVDGSHDSGWQNSSTYTDTGLSAYTSYTYRLTTRDNSYAQNASVSDPAAAVTNPPAGVTAPSLIEGPFYFLSSQNGPTSDLNFDVSVYPGKAIYTGAGNYPGNISRTVYAFFGDGTVTDYRFFRERPANDNVIALYAAGAAMISDLTTPDTDIANANWADVWTSSDPGFDFGASADFASNSLFINVSPSLSGSIDISGASRGIVYFLYGAYRNRPNIDLVMSGAGQTNVTLNDAGNDDGANNNENYIVAVSFLNAARYDAINYTFNSSNGRFMGVVLWAPPPPGTVIRIR